MSTSIPASTETSTGQKRLYSDDDSEALPAHASAKTPYRQEPNPIKLSRKRWFILVAVATFGLSLTLASDTGPVLNLMLDLLEMTPDEYIYISQIFYCLIIILIIPTASLLDRFGIRSAMLVAVCFFVLNGIFRELLYFTELPGWSHNKTYYYILSCALSTQTYAIYLLLPLKVSETWFSVSERSIAWILMQVQFDVGACITSFWYPRLMKKTEDVKLLAHINIAAVCITAITCIACVSRSEPDTPPSKRVAAASKDTAPLLVSLKRMLKHRDILLHIIHGGICSSMPFAVGSLLQDILLSRGFTPIFAGNYMSINAFISIIVLAIMASFVHKVRNITMACKLGSFGQSLLFLCHLSTLAGASPGWIIICVAIVLTIFKGWNSPHSNNMTAHLACGTVSQAKIVGFSVIIVTLITCVIQSTFAYLIEPLGGKKSNYNYSLLFLAIICLVNEVIYLTFFQGKSAAEECDDDVNQGIENTSYEEDPR